MRRHCYCFQMCGSDGHAEINDDTEKHESIIHTNNLRARIKRNSMRLLKFEVGEKRRKISFLSIQASRKEYITWKEIQLK